MQTDVHMNNYWSNVIYVDSPEPTISYRTALTTYEESLTKGRYVGRGWNSSGFVSYYDGRIDPAQHPSPQAFQIEIDGQLLASDWEWGGIEQANETGVAGHPQHHVTVTLKHAVRPVTIRVHTLLDGTPVITRYLEITNTGAQPAALADAFPWSGVLQKTSRWQSHLSNATSALYSVGYCANSHWGNEGDFRWFDMPQAGYEIAGRYRRDRHRHPWCVLRNNATGEYFVLQIAWSGGYSIAFDLDADLGTTDAVARLYFQAGPDAPAPQRIIAPGETILTPEVHMGMVFGDLDHAIQSMHDHLRRSVFMPQPRGRGEWIESGIGPEIEITVDQVNHAIDVAGEVGAEVFFIDASWYAPPASDWWSTVGDWEVDRSRFSEGIKPFRDRVHDKGMLWGLWMDAERIAKKSRVAIDHPDWVSVAYDGEKRLGDLLDLTNPAAAAWMEDQIGRVIEQNELEFFRLDYNVGGLGMGAKILRDGFAESGYWRYYETLYAIYDRLRLRFPTTIFENCAGGGGRTDIGLVRRFSHTWVTDWQIAPRSFTITNGMTMALPPEYVDRLVGGQTGYSTAEYDFQSRLLLFVRPTLAFLHPRGAQANPHLIARTRHWISLYKDFIRPFKHTGRIYHHTPAFEGPEPQGWGVLELASNDRTHAICGLFQLSSPQLSEYLLRLRGLDVSRRYKVTFDNSGSSCVLEGFVLAKQGMSIRLEGALTSELLLIEAI